MPHGAPGGKVFQYSAKIPSPPVTFSVKSAVSEVNGIESE
jgi:hypothetical protein